MYNIRNRINNAKRNIISGFANKIILMLLPFIVRTVMIRKLGAEYLGINSLFSSILQVLNISELGFSSAIVYSLYKPIAENDVSLVNALMTYYKRIYKAIGIIVSLCGIAILPFLRFFINGNVPSDVNIYILFTIYLFNTSLSYYAFGYKNALLNACQRNDIVSNISTLSQSLMYFLQIIMLIVTSNYYCYLIIIPAFTLLNNVLTLYFANKLFPAYTGTGNLDREQIENIKKQVAGLLVHRLCLVSRNSLDSIFISAFLGLKYTAIYSNYYYVMNSIVGILSVIGNGMLSGIGNSIATESVSKNYLDMKKFNFIYMLISGWCTICLICLYQPFMEIWVGHDLMLDFPMVILFSSYFYILKMGDVRGTYSDAAGLWWQNRSRAIIETITNLILNFLLVQFLGLYGIILATLISLFIINFIFGSKIIFKHYFKTISIKEYYISHGIYAVVTIIIATIVYLTLSFVTLDGVTGFFIKAFISGAFTFVLYILTYWKYSLFRNSMLWISKNIFNIDYK